MIDLLFHVTHAEAGRYLVPLLEAARTRGVTVACFFTFDGVCTAADPRLPALLAGGLAVVCEESWRRFRPGSPCPVEAGSQTVNSALMGEARRVVSL